MPANIIQLVAACLALVLLVLVVAVAMFVARLRELRAKRIHPQAVSTAAKMAARLENTQPADNFRNLFELPVLFYALVAIAIATRHVPDWLVLGAWLFVLLRVLHSFIHCSYNRVTHRLVAFSLGFMLVIGLWLAFFLTLPRGPV